MFIKRIKQIVHLFLAVITFAGLARCAHPVAPTGGPQDITPPVILGTEPENFSTNFSAKRVEIEFDEFIQLKDATKQIFTSPPMVDKPEYTVKGKSLVIELKETPRENMTYVINFGSAITDLNEGNALKGFSYVFSTGDVIDSLAIVGRVVNAFDLKPVENILLCVYAADQDTIPLDSMPVNVAPISATRTLAEGKFNLTNLPPNKYLVFALEDLNSNYYYDLPNERIAFLDSLVIASYPEIQPDSLTENDSTAIGLPQAPEANVALDLYLFEEFDSTQRILSSSFLDDGSLKFAFRLPARDFTITPLNFPPAESWKLEEYSRNGDTVVYWPLEHERDTFKLELAQPGKVWDTVTLVRKSQPGGLALRKKENERKPLQFNLNTRVGVLAPGKELRAEFSEPLKSFDFSGIWLFGPQDTLQPEWVFIDSLKRKAAIRAGWNENQRYELLIPDSAFIGISGAYNDSTRMVVRTKALATYGSLFMKLMLDEGCPDLIMELLTEKEALIKRHIIKESGVISYLHLDPGTYKVKMTYDINGNGKWDTGNYMRKQLPERVIYFEKPISVRENWEIQEEWRISP